MATQLTSFDAYLDLSSPLKESVPTLDTIFSALKLDRPRSAQEVKLPTEGSTNLLEKERLTSAICPPLPMTNAVSPECRPAQRVPRNVACGTLLNRRNNPKKIPQSQLPARRSSSRVVRPSFLSRFSMDGLYGTTETAAAQVAHDLKRERIAAKVRFHNGLKDLSDNITGWSDETVGMWASGVEYGELEATVRESLTLNLPILGQVPDQISSLN